MDPNFVDEKTWAGDFRPVYERIFRIWRTPEIVDVYPQDVFTDRNWRMVLVPRNIFNIEGRGGETHWPEETDPERAWPPFFRAIHAVGEQELVASLPSGKWWDEITNWPIKFAAEVEGLDNWGLLDTILYMLDCVIFGRSDRWGMLTAYFNDGLSIVGGDDAFMADFIDRSGGLAAMQRRFVGHVENTIPLIRHDEAVIDRYCDEVGWPKPNWEVDHRKESEVRNRAWNAIHAKD